MQPSYLRYANQGAIRSQPLSPQLASALSFLPELGVTAEIFSGGQPAAGGPRVGSTRHNHGNAADAFFYKDGQKLDWNNPEHQPIFQEIVKRGKQSGITGFGAGDGYMRPGSMHIGFGNPAVWGAGGKGTNAPDWLASAYGGVPNAPKTRINNAFQDSGMAPQRYTDFSNAPGLANAPRRQQGGGVGSFINNNRDMLRGLGLELLASGLDSRNRFTGRGAMMGSMSDSKRKETAQKTSAVADYLSSTGAPPELAQLAQAGLGDNALSIWGSLQKGDSTTAMKNFQAAQADPRFAEFLKNQKGDSGSSVYGTPIYTQGDDGKLGVGVIGKDGTFKSLDTGGANITQPTTMLDLGTQRVLAGSRTGETIRTDQIDNAGKAEQTAIGGARGEAQGQAIVGLPNAVAQADAAMSIIDSIVDDPGLSGITGMIQGRIPPTTQAGTDLNVKIEQLKGKTFLEAFQSLKGGGTITEIEGQKAEAAIARLDRAQSTEAYRSALTDLKEVLQKGVARAKAKAGMSDAAEIPTGTGSSSPSTPSMQKPIVREDGTIVIQVGE